MFHRFTCVDLNFLGWFLAGFGCVFCLFGVFVLCCLVFCCFLFPHERDLLSCVRIVCNLERPSELSWRARHGRKKKLRADRAVY